MRVHNCCFFPSSLSLSLSLSDSSSLLSLSPCLFWLCQGNFFLLYCPNFVGKFLFCFWTHKSTSVDCCLLGYTICGHVFLPSIINCFPNVTNSFCIFSKFSPKISKIIISCVTSSSTSILVNGVALERFEPSSDTRQGDPLSLYLFILCMGIWGISLSKNV